MKAEKTVLHHPITHVREQPQVNNSAESSTLFFDESTEQMLFRQPIGIGRTPAHGTERKIKTPTYEQSPER